jgi:hypothetical protein
MIKYLDLLVKDLEVGDTVPGYGVIEELGPVEDSHSRDDDFELRAVKFDGVWRAIDDAPAYLGATERHRWLVQRETPEPDSVTIKSKYGREFTMSKVDTSGDLGLDEWLSLHPIRDDGVVVDYNSLFKKSDLVQALYDLGVISERIP